MPEYRSPGVFVSQTPSANKAIQPASTSIAGMVGVTERGPANVPTLVTSAGEFNSVFGGFLDHANYSGGRDALPYAVRGFFDNGGSHVHVVRVLGTGHATSRFMFQDDTPADVLQVCASAPGAWGDRLSVTLTHRQRVDTSLADAASNEASRVRLTSSIGVAAGTVLMIAGKHYLVARVEPGNIIELADKIDGALSAGVQVVSQEFDLSIVLTRDHVVVETEIFTRLNLNPASINYAPAVLGSCDLDGGSPSGAGGSRLVRLHVPDEAARQGNPQPIQGIGHLADGADGTVDATQVIGTASDDPNRRTGIEALANAPEISLVAAPGWTDIQVQKALLTHCEQQLYRFAVLDAPSGADVAQARSHRSQFDSTRGAIYYPWLKVSDPFASGSGQHRIPPAGHVLGIYARTDRDRGVWKAPANKIIRNVLDLDYVVGDEEQAILNSFHINALRDFRPAQRGLRVWGARTLSSDPEWKYVPVRRTSLFIQHSLDSGLQWVAAEANAEPLWEIVRQTVTAFLFGIWRNGGLTGFTAEQAFFVHVGFGITMDQADMDDGRMVLEVGVALLRPAEFAIIRVSKRTAEAAD
jgi:uncharacterized protein